MVRMQDVADKAGVSLATVSIVVNNAKPLTPETRARVEAAIAELGFRRNVLTRGLASRHTSILALTYPAFERGRLGGTALQVMTGAAEAAHENGYHLVMWPVGHDDAGLEGLMALHYAWLSLQGRVPDAARRMRLSYVCQVAGTGAWVALRWR